MSIDVGPEVTRLGVALGALTDRPDGAGFNTDFLDRPNEVLSQVLADEARRDALLGLLADVLGTTSDRFDLPETPPGETWIPLLEEGAGGLYLVTQVVGTAGDERVRLAVAGRLHRRGDGIDASVSVHVPLVEVRTDAAALVGTPDGAIAVAARLAGEDGPLLDVDGMTVGALTLRASLATDPDADGPASVGIVVEGLRFAPGGPPTDIDLLDLVGNLDAEVVRLLLAALRARADAAAELGHLLALVGLGPPSAIPPLPLSGLLVDPRSALVRWLRAVVLDAAARSAWLAELGGLFGVSVPPGSEELCLVETAESTVCVTLTADTDDATGAPRVRVGVVARHRVTGGTATGSLRADADLVHVLLADPVVITPIPSGHAGVELTGPLDGGGAPTPLVDTPTVDGHSVRVGALLVGVALHPDRLLNPTVLATDVRVDAVDFASLDLTDADAIVGAAADVADSAVGDVVATLTDLLDGSSQARALAVLLGLIPPAGFPWALELVDPVGLLSDPLRAVACYHARVLAVDGAWALLLAHVPLLADPGAPPAVPTGSGTVADPWQLVVAAAGAGGPTSVLLAWSEPRDGAPHLRVAAEIRWEAPLDDDATLTAALRSDLLDATLPQPAGCTGPVALDVAGCHALTLAVGDDLRLDLGRPVVLIERAEVGLRWCRGADIEPLVRIRQPRVVRGGRLVELPDIVLPDGDGLDLGALSDEALRVVVDLIGSWLTGGLDSFSLGSLLALPDDGTTQPLRDVLDDPDRGVWDRLRLPALAELVAGQGTYADPWHTTALPDPLPQILAWVDPDGPPAGPPIPHGVLPPQLRRALDDDGEALSPARLATLLRRLAVAVPGLADVVDQDLGAALTALADRLAGSDGLVPTAVQQPAGWDVVELGPTTHLTAPADLDRTTLGPVGPASGHVLVAAPLLWAAPWADTDRARTIDLREPGRDAATFALDQVTGPGPWVVLLPTRSDAVSAAEPDGLDGLTARLRAAVTAVRAVVGDPVTVVAHGSSGHPARLVAAEPGLVDHLVTIGTPHATAPVAWVADDQLRHAIRTVQRLRAHAVEGGADLGWAGKLVATLGATLDGIVEEGDGPDLLRRFVPFPLEDLVAPPSWPALPPGVSATAVVCRLAPDDVHRALTTVVGRSLEALVAPPLGRAAPTHLGIGVRTTAATEAGGSGELLVDARVRADLELLEVAPGPHRAVPTVVVEVDLARHHGWLVRPIDDGLARPQDPRIRRARLELSLELGEPDPTTSPAPRFRARLVLHDVTVLGRWHERWVVDDSTVGSLLDGTSGATGALPEVRLLLGVLAASLGPVPASGALRRATELLAALDAVTLDDVGAVEFVADGLARLLRSEGVALGDLAATPGAVDGALDALAALGGGTRSGDTLILIDHGGLELALLGALTGPTARLRLRTTAPAAVLDSFVVELEATATTDGRVAFSGVLTLPADLGPAGRPRLTVTLDPDATDPLHVSLGFPDGELVGLGPDVTLVPTPDLPALERLVGPLLQGELLRQVLTFARERQPAAVDPVLDVLGLLGAPDTPLPVRSLAGLVANPGGWLSSSVSLGVSGPERRIDPARLAALVDAIGGLAGDGAGGGTLPLPGGATLAVDVVPGGRARLRVDAPPPAAGGVGFGGTLAVLLGADLDVTATVDARVAIAGGDELDGARVEVGLGPGGPAVGITVTPTGGDPVTLPVLPPANWGRLTAMAGAAAAAGVRRVLPLVLDAAADEVPAIGAVGDALGVRSTGDFDGDALVALSEDPARPLLDGTLAGGIATAAQQLLLAVGVDAAPPAVPHVTVTTGVGVTTVTVVPAAGLQLDVDLGATAGLCVTLDPVEPVAGLALGGSVCVDATGVTGAEATLAVTDAALLGTDPVELLPFVTLQLGDRAVAADGTPTAGRVLVGIWDGPPADAGRHAVATQFAEGTVGVVCTDAGGAGAANHDACIAEVALGVVLPLVGDLALAADAVVDLLDARLLATDGLLGNAMVSAGMLARNAGGYSITGDLFDDLATVGDRLLALTVELVGELDGNVLGASLRPLRLAPTVHTDDRRWYGLRLSLDEPLLLADGADVGLSLDGYRGQFGGGDPTGLTVLLLSHPHGDPDGVSVTPRIVATEIGLRVTGAGGGALLDAPIGIEAVGVFGSYTGGSALAPDGSVTGWATDGGGVRLELQRLALPLGGGGDGGNPVAHKVLSQASESGSAGDDEELAPAFDVDVAIDGTGVAVRLGLGEPPWWVPIQRSFGPLYIDQVGALVEPVHDPGRVGVLFDGGLVLGDLAVGVDDLSLVYDIDDDGLALGLAGLAIGYNGGGLILAGGLRRHGPEYLGMLELRFGDMGLTVLGGWGEHPVRAGSSETYTALLVFGALSASLGGPPPFFVTGIGAGFGVNRQLVLPAGVDDVLTHPLVQAMKPDSTLSSDPMGALEVLGRTFPPHRGTFWFAAGVRFTSFVLVESVAVLSVEVGDGVEVGLLGLSDMMLPSADYPMASIQLALRARFSTREGVMAIQAQLTDSSWVLSEDCRLIGGFAFVVWFRDGQFVLTLGGYHPRFPRPTDFPDVPRLGYQWSVSDAITIKGGLYFALTSSAVMAGGSFSASYRTSWAWASFEMGANALVQWDPFAYDFEVYIRVSAGVRIRVCVPLLGCATAGFSFSIGARIHVEGPEFRGTAELDLDVVTLTVRFGATGTPNPDQGLDWNSFRRRYLTDGDTGGLESSLGAGRYVESGRADPDAAVDGPWQVLAEFTFRVTTTVASNRFNDGDIAEADTLDLGPMRQDDVTTHLKVQLLDAAGRDRSDDAGVRIAPRLEQLPEAVWATREASSDAPPAAHLVTAVVGAALDVSAVVGDATGEIDVNQIDRGDLVHPLPLRLSLRWRDELGALVAGDRDLVAWATGRTVHEAIPTLVSNATLTAVRDHVRWRLASSAPGMTSDAGTTADSTAAPQSTAVGLVGDTPHATTAPAVTPLSMRAAPPRVRSLARGTAPPMPMPVEVTVAETPPVRPIPAQRRLPVLDALLHEVTVPGEAVAATTVARADADLPRIAAPSLAAVRSATVAGFGARLHLRRTETIEEGRTPGQRAATHIAGDRHEWRAADPRLRADVATAMRDVTAAFQRGGARLRAGDVQVWRFTDSRRDRDQSRRTVEVAGGIAVRVVALSRSGRVLVDMTVEGKGRVAVPRGTARLALAAIGHAPGRLTGWHAGTRLARISRATALAPGATVRAEASDSRRAATATATGWVPAADLVPLRGTVDTVLPVTTRTVVVGLEPVDGDAEADGFALSLAGARRVRGEPLVVRHGERLYGLFAIRPEDAAAAVRASVAVDEHWHLAAVVGSADEPAVVRSAVVAGDLQAHLTGPTLTAAGGATVRYVDPQEDDQ